MTCEVASCLPGHDLHCLPIALLLRGTGTGRLKKTPDAEQESATTNKLLNRGEKQHIPRVFPRLSFTQYGRASKDTDILNWSQCDVSALHFSWKRRNLTCIFSCCIREQGVDLIHLTAWGRRVDKRKIKRLWDGCRLCVRILIRSSTHFTVVSLSRAYIPKSCVNNRFLSRHKCLWWNTRHKNYIKNVFAFMSQKIKNPHNISISH